MPAALNQLAAFLELLDVAGDSLSEPEPDFSADKMDEAIGLIVTSTGDKYSNDFRRIGLFLAVPPAWFTGTIRSRIRLF